MSKRSRRTLFICVAAVLFCLASLAGYYALLHKSDQNNPNTQNSTNMTQATEAPAIVILDKTKDSAGAGIKNPVKELSVKNQADEYFIKPREDGTMAVEAYADLPAEISQIGAMCKQIASLTAVQELEKNEADSAYGFDQPTATVTALFHDDTTETVVFGNKTPYEDGYYCRLKGSDKLYIAETYTAELFTGDGLSLIGKSLIAPPAIKEGDEESNAQLLDLALSGRVRPQAISIKVDTKAEYPSLTTLSALVMTAPHVRAVNSDFVNPLMLSMTRLTASGVAAVHPDEAMLKEYGLSDPYSTAAFTLAAVRVSSAEGGGSKAEYYNARKHMVLLGDKDENGRYYALVDSLPIVYLLDPASVPWAEKQYIDITNNLLFLYNITTVSSVTVSENGQDTVYDLTHYPEKENRDAQLVVTSGGKTYNTKEFRTLYELMIGIHRVADPEPGAQAVGTPVLKLTLHFTNGSEPATMSLYPMTASRYLCVLNDGEQTALKISDVEKFLKQFHNYQTGQPVVTPY